MEILGPDCWENCPHGKEKFIGEEWGICVSSVALETTRPVNVQGENEFSFRIWNSVNFV